jgi:hypothetical protein
MLTLLTATGARPEAWAICERLMARQSYTGPVRWVIVDDGPEPQPLRFAREGWTVEVIRPAPAWAPGQNTQHRNLLAGLAVIAGSERVVLIEDDDYYAPGYLAAVDKRFGSSELIGENRARYFNVATGRGEVMVNERHSSLCSTACRNGGLRALRAACLSGERFIDLVLWRDFPGRLYPAQFVVGIKGLPGRGGIGQGHSPDFGRPLRLKKWIGADAELYR